MGFLRGNMVETGPEHGAHTSRIGALIWVTGRIASFCALHHREHNETNICTAPSGGGPSPDVHHAGTLITSFQPSVTVRNKILSCISYLVYAIFFFFLPQLNKTRPLCTNIIMAKKCIFVYMFIISRELYILYAFMLLTSIFSFQHEWFPPALLVRQG